MTASPGPTVSAIVAVQNGEPYLAEALESILTQSLPPHEVIVVDGASEDASVAIAESYERVRVLAQDGDGLAGAWNQGLRESTGDLIAFLDSDDIWMPGKLEAQVDELERRGEIAGTDGLARIVILPGAVAPPGLRPEWLEGEHPAHMPGTLLVRREVFDMVGDFDAAYKIALDVDWLARVKDAGLEIATLPRLMLVKRFHPGNLSHSQPDRYRQEMVRALRASATRQRTKGPR